MYGGFYEGREMAEAVFSFEVAAPDLDGLLQEAYQRASALFDGKATIDWGHFDAFDISSLVSDTQGKVLMYQARCCLRVPFHAPEPALWFGKL